MTDLRTTIQKRRETRAKKVCALFTKLKKNSNGSLTAIVDRVAMELSTNADTAISSMGVRYILKKANLI